MPSSGGSATLAEHWDGTSWTFVKVHRPDGLIAKASGGPFMGNDLYNTTGSHQTRSKTLAPGTTGRFYVREQNDGNSDSFLMKGTGSGGGFSVHYFIGTTNITSAVEAGTYSKGIAPSASITIRIVVKARSTVTSSSTRSILLRSASKGDTTMKDTVKAVVFG
jgi:hypothetical protein